MPDHQVIDVDGHCETQSVSDASATGSTYGLLYQNNPNSSYNSMDVDLSRSRVLDTYKRRLTMCLILLSVVGVVFGGFYISAQHNSMEIIKADISDNHVESKEEGIHKEATDFIIMKSPSPLRKKPDVKPEHAALAQAQTHQQSASSTAVTMTESHPKTTTELPDDEISEKPIVNHNANCTNEKKGPKPNSAIPFLKDELKEFKNPIGLLYVMRECPTFEFFECKHEKSIIGYKVTVQVRSINKLFEGIDKKQKYAKSGAAYKAAIDLYNAPEGFNPEEATLRAKLKDCNWIRRIQE